MILSFMSAPPIPSRAGRAPLEDSIPDRKVISNSRERIGKEALALCNRFRRDNNLSELTWSEELFRLCFEHSNNMSEDRVPFSHDGFAERVKRLSKSPGTTAENVFKGSGTEDRISIKAVHSWTNSPGHRANLLGPYAKCAIAFCKSRTGHYYATQMFTS